MHGCLPAPEGRGSAGTASAWRSTDERLGESLPPGAHRRRRSPGDRPPDASARPREALKRCLHMQTQPGDRTAILSRQLGTRESPRADKRGGASGLRFASRLGRISVSAVGSRRQDIAPPLGGASPGHGGPPPGGRSEAPKLSRPSRAAAPVHDPKEGCMHPFSRNVWVRSGAGFPKFHERSWFDRVAGADEGPGGLGRTAGPDPPAGGAEAGFWRGCRSGREVRGYAAHQK